MQIPLQTEAFKPTAEQQRIIELSEGKHLVLAPPGTGKTEMLANRVLLALKRGIPPEKILCLTFTVRAAIEMKKRIQKTAPRALLPELGNVHHYCHHFLYSRKLIPQRMQVIDQDMQSDLMREVTDEFPDDQIKTILDYKGSVPIQELLKAAASLRQLKLEFREDIVQPLSKNDTYMANPVLVRTISSRYYKQKKDLSVIDFDDLLTYTYYFLEKKNAVNPEELCEWIQIDEVQDLNPLQWAIIDKLSIPKAHATYFGDMEQAIFSFIGASAENLNRIAANCTVHNLIKNFRSKSYLLDMFIRYALKTLHVNWDYLPLPGTTVAHHPDDMRICQVPSGERYDDRSRSQSVYIANLLKAEIKSGVLDQTAILVPSNKSADFVSNELERTGPELGFYKVSGFDLFSRIEFRDFKAFCAIFPDPINRIAWSRLFKLFAGIKTQKNARTIVKELFDAGFVPKDFLDETSLLALPYVTEFRRCILGERIVVFDTETTGLNTNEDEIIQIAAVEFIKGERGQTFEVYINTPRELGESEAVHHITREMLFEKGVPSEIGLRRFSEFIGDSILVAHNLSYDRAMVTNAFLRYKIEHDLSRNPMFDTLDLSRRVYIDMKSYKLTDLITKLQLDGVNSHNAMADVLATGELMLRLVKDSETLAGRQTETFRKYESTIYKFREMFVPLWNRMMSNPDRVSSYRQEFTEFINYCFSHNHYKKDTLISESDGVVENPPEFVLKRAEKFMRYTDHCYDELSKKNPFLKVLEETSYDLRRFTEAEILVGDEKIVISTIHKAKGLQFERVIIMGCEEGVFPRPFFLIKTPEEIAESARVLYVGMTRSKRKLLLLYSGQLSRFLTPVRECFEQDLDIFSKSIAVLSRIVSQSSGWLLRLRYLNDQNGICPHDIDKFLADPDEDVRSRAIKLKEKQH